MSRLIKRELPCRGGDVVLIGLSGGADSVALTHALKQEYPALSLAACHLNHQLRGQESDRDQRFAEEYCAQCGIVLYVKKVDVNETARITGESQEECGRRLRYEFFFEAAEKLQQQTAGTVWIATAHTASDQAETVLFHLARGSGMKGLCGIPFQRDRIIRPLLFSSREEVEQYCEEENLTYVTDSTNLSDDYTRNRIRHQVIPVLRQINPSLERSILNTTEIFDTEENFWEQYVAQIYPSVKQEDGLSVSVLQTLHPAVQRRVLLAYLKSNEVPGYFHQVEQALQVLHGGNRCNIKKGLYLKCSKDIFRVAAETTSCPYFEFPLKEGLFESKTGKMYKIQILETNPFAFLHKIYKNVFDILLDCGKICGSITIRQRKSGDRIKFYSSAGTKTLKKLLNEHRIDQNIRGRLFVIADEQGVIAVEGFGVAERVRCDQTTTKLIQIEPVKGTSEYER